MAGIAGGIPWPSTVCDRRRVRALRLESSAEVWGRLLWPEANLAEDLMHAEGEGMVKPRETMGKAQDNLMQR